MTQPNQTPTTAQIPGDGVDNDFTYLFEIPTAAESGVIYLPASGDPVELVHLYHYTITTGSESGGIVTITALPTSESLPIGSNQAIVIYRKPLHTQDQPLRRTRAFDPDLIEEALDNQTRVSQDIARDVGQSVKFPASEPGASADLPTAASRVDTVWTNDASGDLAMLPKAGLSPAFSDWFDVKEDYGAIGNGVADDTTAIQNAITAAGSTGTVYFPPGSYLLSAGLIVPKGIRLVGSGYGDDTTTSSGTPARATVLKWSASAGAGDIVTFISGTASSYLYGPALTGVMLDGNNTAARGLVVSSCSQGEFDIAVTKVVTEGVRLDNGNDVNCQFNQTSVHFVYGSVAGVEGATGLALDGSIGSSGGVTQNFIVINGLYKNGDMMRVKDADNNHILRCHSARGGGGTGYALKFQNGTLHARNNFCHYVVGGVKFESSTHGNRLLQHNSETSHIDADAGSQFNVSAMDHVTGGVWEGPRFQFSDRISIPLKAFDIASGTPVFDKASLLWPCWSFDDAADERIAAMISPPFQWSAGSILGVTIYYVCPDNHTSDDAEFRVQCGSFGDGDSTTTPSEDDTHTVTVPDTQYRLDAFSVTFATPVAYTADDVIGILIGRNGTADSVTGDVDIVGVDVVYQGDGPPNHLGGESWDISPREA